MLLLQARIESNMIPELLQTLLCGQDGQAEPLLKRGRHAGVGEVSLLAVLPRVVRGVAPADNIGPCALQSSPATQSMNITYPYHRSKNMMR